MRVRDGSLCRVDPRVCGGAIRSAVLRSETPGRSPRVRGSHGLRSGKGQLRGSIPACAGEPSRGCPTLTYSGVDPRVCGGARGMGGGIQSASGRSPRVRGSRPKGEVDAAFSGSIPACAGEPDGGSVIHASKGVDPRVCGGATLVTITRRTRPGRSPRVRGSRQGVSDYRPFPGSIPACAGEPSGPAGRGAGGGVDPRVCGGARACSPIRAPSRGRSPRVRGSL